MANSKFKVRNGLFSQNLTFSDSVENPTHEINFDMLATDKLSISGDNANLLVLDDSTGRIGIGTDTPDTLLHVSGGNITLDGTSEINHKSVASSYTLLRAAIDNQDLTLFRISNETTGNTASDTSNYGFSLKYVGTRSGNLNSLSIFSDNQLTAPQIEALTILQDGKIGINHSSPAVRLSVGGDVSVGYADENINRTIAIYSSNTSNKVAAISFENDTLIINGGVANHTLELGRSSGSVYTSQTYTINNNGNPSYFSWKDGTREILHLQEAGKLTLTTDPNHTSGDITTQTSFDLYNPVESNVVGKGSIITFSDNYFDGTNYIKTTRAAIKGGTATLGNTADGFLAFYTDKAGASSMEEQMRITKDGYVGINTSAPTAMLQVDSPDGNLSSLRIGRQDTANYWDFNHAGADLRIYNNAGENSDILLGVDASGTAKLNKVGIGIATPTSVLHVQDTTNPTITISNGGGTSPAPKLQFFRQAGVSASISYDVANKDLYFINESTAAGNIIFNHTENDEALRITNAGYVGIGTDTPVSTLHVEDDSGITIRTTTNAAGAKITFSDQTADWGQFGTITYKHSDNAISTEPVSSGDGFLFSSSQTNMVVRIQGSLDVDEKVNIDGTLNVEGETTFNVAGQNVILKADAVSRNTLQFNQDSSLRWTLDLNANGDLNFVPSSTYIMKINGERIFADDYHPNADKWTTARTVTFAGGDVSGSFSIDGSANVNNVDLQVADDSHTHDGRYYTETEIQNDNISMRRLLVNANGVPTSNLGTPTIAEMALFDEQFDNKTAFFPITNVFIETSTDGTTWVDAGVSDTNKRRLVGGDTNAGVAIPYNTPYFRIRFKAISYRFLNALYSYWSTQGHSSKVQIYKKLFNTTDWVQHTNSEVNVSAWPGHLYLPFSTVPFNPSNASQFDEVAVVFIPNWNATYSSNNINISRIQMWGGYPAGKRNIYSVNEFQDVTFPAEISSDTVSISGTDTSSSTSTGALTVAGGVGIAENLNIGGTLKINGITLTDGDNDLIVGANSITYGQSGVESRLYSNSDFVGIVTPNNYFNFDQTRVNIASTATSTSTSTGALTVSGGVGIAENLNVGGDFSAGTITADSFVVNDPTATENGFITYDTAPGDNIQAIKIAPPDLDDPGQALLVKGGAGVPDLHLHLTPLDDAKTTIFLGTDNDHWSVGQPVQGGNKILSAQTTGAIQLLANGDNITLTAPNNAVVVGSTTDMQISATTSSTSTTTGALTVSGGVGIAENLNVGGDLNAVDISATTLTFPAGAVTDALNLSNNNIIGVNNIVFADPGPNEGLQWSNIRIFESPNDLTTNSGGNLQVTYGGTRRFTVDNLGIDVNGRALISGDISATNATLTGYLRGPSSFVIDPAAHGDDTGTVVIAGNLQVDGITTTINSTTVDVGDKNIVLGSNATADTQNDGAGISVYRPDSSNSTLLWDETDDTFDFSHRVLSPSFAVRDTDAVIYRNSDDLELITYSGFNINLMPSGNVGIGTTDPQAPLHLFGTDGETIRFGLNNTVYGKFSSGTAGARFDVTGANGGFGMAFSMDDDTKMTLLPNGNFGIGEATPLSKLHVKDGDITVENGKLHIASSSNAEGGEGGGGTGVPVITFGESEGTAVLNTSMSVGYDGDGYGGDANHVFIGQGDADTVIANRFFAVTFGGDVGVGTIAPSAKLHINALANDGILLSSNNALLGATASGQTQLLYWSGSNKIAYWGRNTNDVPSGTGDTVQQHEFRTAGSTRLTIDANGKLIVATGEIDLGTTHAIREDTATLTTTTETQIASYAVATFGGAKIVIQATRGSERHMTELLVVHDGTTASATEYASIYTGAAPLATYDVDISGGNVRVLATSASATSTVYKVAETLMFA